MRKRDDLVTENVKEVFFQVDGLDKLTKKWVTLFRVKLAAPEKVKEGALQVEEWLVNSKSQWEDGMDAIQVVEVVEKSVIEKHVIKEV